MLGAISRFALTVVLVFFLLFATPTLLFLIKSYYLNLITSKTYVGVIQLPIYIEKSNDIVSSAKSLFRSPEIKAVVLKIDGLGGNPGACQALFYDLLALKITYQKPLVAYCESMCSGGSYLIGLAADSIISTKGAVFCNIGSFDEIKLDSSSETKSQAIFETVKKTLITQYKRLLNEHRKNYSHETLPSCITGEEAKQYGLIDSLGGNNEIEHVLRAKTVIDGEIVQVYDSLLEQSIGYLYRMVALRDSVNMSNIFNKKNHVVPVSM